MLPTVDGERAYLDEAPAWNDYDPDDPGVFVPEWDQGQVDVGNGDVVVGLPGGGDRDERGSHAA